MYIIYKKVLYVKPFYINKHRTSNCLAAFNNLTTTLFIYHSREYNVNNVNANQYHCSMFAKVVYHTVVYLVTRHDLHLCYLKILHVHDVLAPRHHFRNC